MRSELFKLRFEQLVLLACGGFLVQDQNVADVVGMDLHVVSTLSCAIH
jgi:hypothetical protein